MSQVQGLHVAASLCWATDAAYSSWNLPRLFSPTSHVSAHLLLVQSKGDRWRRGSLAPSSPAPALLLARPVSPVPHYYCYHCCHLYYMNALSWQDHQHTMHGKVHVHTKYRDEYVLLSIEQQESAGTEVLNSRMGNWIPFQCLNKRFILSKVISSQPISCTQRYFNQLRPK